MSAITAQELELQMPDASKLLSDEPEMESSLHYMQLLLLVTCLEWAWQERDDFFIGANLTIYFSRQQLKTRDFRGPDFFLVKNTNRAPRNSWVTWEEDGRYPDLIIELRLTPLLMLIARSSEIYTLKGFIRLNISIFPLTHWNLLGLD